TRTTAEKPPLGTLGKFVLLQPLGQGAFGTVYKARDPDLDRLVAIKVPRPDNMGSGDRLDRFLREARKAAQLRHPSIVPVHEVGQHRGIVGQGPVATRFGSRGRQTIIAVSSARTSCEHCPQERDIEAGCYRWRLDCQDEDTHLSLLTWLRY